MLAASFSEVPVACIVTVLAGIAGASHAACSASRAAWEGTARSRFDSHDLKARALLWGAVPDEETPFHKRQCENRAGLLPDWNVA